ncbi:nucleoside hydrolase [Murimonas intestini]|uniref:nucleoside hydrolase n=1 Tax=Murimonas intestini TaxID=1337051 RepID=UPI0011DD043E|nr:nucleoside hydrolase [Murimonas intestini]
MTESERLQKLQRPQGKIDVVIDTDTYNEVDDQYALAYLIKSDDKLNLKAVYAAPFFNSNSAGPKDGMERSYQEIMNVLELMDREDLKQLVHKGADRYLPDEKQPVESPAARNLVELAMERDKDHPLYVVAIAAITNVASAILMEPAIIDRIVVVWLGGHSFEWPDTREFNMYQDVAAARIVFGCGVPLVQLPCMGVVSEFATTGPELNYWLKGKNKLCDYLVSVTEREGEATGQSRCWSRIIWDVTAVGWLLDDRFMYDRLEHSPIPEYDDCYAFNKTRHFIKYVFWINRDLLFEDLFKKLSS